MARYIRDNYLWWLMLSTKEKMDYKVNVIMLSQKEEIPDEPNETLRDEIVSEVGAMMDTKMEDMFTKIKELIEAKKWVK